MNSAGRPPALALRNGSAPAPPHGRRASTKCVVCGAYHREPYCPLTPPEYRLSEEEQAAVRRAVAYTKKRMRA